MSASLHKSHRAAAAAGRNETKYLNTHLRAGIISWNWSFIFFPQILWQNSRPPCHRHLKLIPGFGRVIFHPLIRAVRRLTLYLFSSAGKCILSRNLKQAGFYLISLLVIKYFFLLPVLPVLPYESGSVSFFFLEWSEQRQKSEQPTEFKWMNGNDKRGPARDVGRRGVHKEKKRPYLY